LEELEASEARVVLGAPAESAGASGSITRSTAAELLMEIEAQRISSAV